MPEVLRPAHAYVPGLTARHPEGAFDPLKVGIKSGMTEAEMADSLAWQAGLAYRADGYYWECHEVLEALWLVAPEGPLRSYLQAVIQMANAQLKEKMGRPKAARRLADIVCALLQDCSGRAVVLGQPVEGLRHEALEMTRRLRETQ